MDVDRLRFDFSHHAPMQFNELRTVEQLVNEQIRHNHNVATQQMRYDDAIKRGAMALFGEKYGADVRVVAMGDFSTELCGGTHVVHSGDIGFFKIISESGVAAGIRRVEAVTGQAAVDYAQQREAQLLAISDTLKASPQEVSQKITQLLDHARQLERELTSLKSKLAALQSGELGNQVREIKGVKILAARLEGANAKILRETLDNFKYQL